GVLSADVETGRVRLAAGTRLHRLPELLAPYGLALPNMGDIDRQSIAGATSTGTHGTGLGFGGLATMITGAVLVTGDGSVLTVSETENAELLPAVRLGLGALGILVELELQLVPAYLLRAVEHPEAFEVIDEFRARVEAADHFELYWWPHTDRVMTKTNTRLPLDADRKPVGAFSNWIEEEVMSNGALALMCNLGHLAPGVTPSINRLATKVYGDREYTDHSYEVFTAPRRVRFREMEYALPLDEVPAALHELRAMIDASGWRISFPVEVRAAAPDENWLSTAHGRESGYIAVHRYVKDDPEAYFRAAEQIFLAHGGRPHWGKMHYLDAAVLADRYPRFGDFLAVRDRLDPQRVFRNAYLDRVLGG
ncbi:MAG TPA: D-arabinono-1,4-lactone oxidase, partial [Protaetiibacter sp.]|nr:D-arabinono-1,4-lactone oxidase [Protaetiibacter sp.]